MDESTPIDPDASALRVDRLARLVGLGALALLAVTWKLWTPQDVFPRVPLLYWAPPRWLDWVSLALMVAGLVGLLIHRRLPERRTAATLTACGFALQFLADQHRLQPWAWQFFILALVIALADDRTILVGWRWLVISIYAYSALSKFDAAFQWGVGDLLLKPVEGLFQWSANRAPFGWTQFRSWLLMDASLLLPLSELAIAVLLSMPRSRRMGMYGSWGMHLTLLWVLGPLGLDHSAGVLLWNIFFILQNALLYPDLTQSAEHWAHATVSARKLTDRAAWVILALSYAWPALYPFGWCDAWPGWAVYAPPIEYVVIQVDESSTGQLPAGARETYLPGGLYHRNLVYLSGINVDPNQWSLKTLAVPSYPASRFRAAIALALIEGSECNSTEIIVLRRTNRRQLSLSSVGIREYKSRDEIRNYADTFWFNAYPECVYRRQAGERRDVSPPGD